MAVSAPAEKRVALVIGNAAYDSFGKLANPGNDAEDLAALLRKSGFDVIDGRDLSRRDMDRKLAQFSRLATDADTALVYYAGHGLQYQSQNYLVPVDAQLRDGFDVPFETISVEFVISALDNAKGARILILDACRDLPLKDVGNNAASHGLARAVGRKGLILAYATQADSVAFDGTGRNSFFAGALLKAMQEPGLEIGQVFQQVASTVSGLTNGRQLPEITRSYPGEVFLNHEETDMQAWSRLRRSNQLAELRQFIAKYPNSLLIDDAMTRIQLLEARATPDRNEQREPALPRQDMARDTARREEEERLAEVARRKREEEAKRLEQARQETARQETARQETARLEAARVAEQARLAAEAARAQQAAKLDAEKAAPTETALATVPTTYTALPTGETAPKPAAAGEAPAAASEPAAAPVVKTASLSQPVAEEKGVSERVVRAVQQRLVDLGCYQGRPESSWGRQSSEALDQFYRLSQASDPAKTRAVKIVSHMPDQATLDVLNTYNQRICPVSCPTGSEPKGEVCVKITCPTGMELDGNECHPRRKPIQATLPAETTKKAPAAAAKETAKPKLAKRPEPQDEEEPVQKPKAKAKAAPVVRETPKAAKPVVREAARPVAPKVKVVEPIRVRAPVPSLARTPRYAPGPAAASAAPSYTPAEIGASRMMSRMP
ncbi:caspase family protein [Methylobacterium sp. WSM2598]|uniref:caspase family protein n=1 Tax=Methylobacterium sp. WSM2598 TaxID=398261 RepID=UPI00036C8C85|nr:caspase family protein [Methylobacterium sp. WSM2598]